MSKKDLTIVLVHGGWGDSSHWKYIIPALVAEGYKVRAVQNPLTSLQDDIDKTKDLIDAQEGKVLLVGHSYGGAVITGAGNHNKVLGLVYIAAFAPDKDESIEKILSRRAPLSGAASIYPDAKGFLWIKYEKYYEAFCEDADNEDALVMGLGQRPLHQSAFFEKSGEPAWRNKPSWYQVSNHDLMIPADTEKEMAENINSKKIIHLDARHASLVTHPKEVSALILEAAQAVE